MIVRIVLLAAVVASLAYLVHCPILKPWFGFRRPPGHCGRWFT